jgi:excisionase family DNA binding protein
LLHGSAGSSAAEVALLDAGEVATRLGVCRDTVYELCKRGELRHVRVLNAIRVHPADLAAFMAGRR